MTHTRTFAALSAALLLGCATTQWVWTRDGATTEDYYRDEGQCRAQAFAAPNATQNLLQVAIILNSCMQGKGWRQTPK